MVEKRHAFPFTKMHGQGNDFVVIDARKLDLPAPDTLAKQACERRFGIGGDGLVLILPSDSADVRMDMYNPDGSAAQTCGNALCCLGRYLLRDVPGKLTIDTAAGTTPVALTKEAEGVWISVGMGQPRYTSPQLPETDENGRCVVAVNGLEVDLTPVSMGNPHGVIFTEATYMKVMRQVAEALTSRTDIFPEEANIELVTVQSRRAVTVEVHERGAGWTHACGSGACAVLAAGVRRGYLDSEIALHFPGGTVRVQQEAKTGGVTYTGRAHYVAEGLGYFRRER